MPLRRHVPVLAALSPLLLVAPIHVAGASPAEDVTACSADSPRTEALQIWVLPEAGSRPMVEAIESAQSSIRVMIYLLGDGPILDALERKARSGVPVRVILDGARFEENLPYHDSLVAAGADVHWSNPEFVFTHAKTMILDEAAAMISTGNYGEQYLEKERNYLVRDADPADVAVLVRLFEADWRWRRPNLRCTRLLISPVNAHERLLDLIDSATETLDIESMHFTDDEVREAVVARAAAGVAVRVILADPRHVEAGFGAAAFLGAHGIPVKTLRDLDVHVKSILVDGRRAYLGSENLSTNSLENNREIGLIADEPAVIDAVSTTFAKDWASGKRL
jgi:cardiolipin synthase A/B